MTRSIAELIRDGALIVGDGYRAKNVELGLEGLPFARAGNLNEGFDFRGADLLRQDRLARVGGKRSHPEDVVFTSKGTVGRFAYVKATTPEFVYSPQLCFWRVMDRAALGPHFLYFWMRGDSCRAQFSALKGQTDMADYISLRDQRRITIEIPPPDEQARIVQVLGALDDKIDSNRRLAGLLEQVAEAEFRARFVDFVGSDGLARVESSAASAGWRMARIDELAKINAVAHSSSDHPPELEYVDISSVGVRSVEETKRLRFEDAPSRARRRLRPDDTIVSTVRPERRAMAFVHEASPELTASTGFAVVTPTVGAPTFVYRAVTSDACIDHLSQSASGSAYPAVNPSVLAAWRVACPPDSGRAYEEFARPVEALRHTLDRESKTLAAIRDALLPKLVSGQIRVPDTADPAEVVGPAAEELSA